MPKKKSAKSRRKRSWHNVYKRKHRSGQVGSVVDLGLINGMGPLQIQTETGNNGNSGVNALASLECGRLQFAQNPQ